MIDPQHSSIRVSAVHLGMSRIHARTRAAFSATADVSRDDFAIRWNRSVLAGVLAVGRTLHVEIDSQAVRS